MQICSGVNFDANFDANDYGRPFAHLMRFPIFGFPRFLTQSSAFNGFAV